MSLLEIPPWNLHQVGEVPAAEEPALAVEVEEVFQSVSAGGAAETVWMPTPVSLFLGRWHLKEYKIMNMSKPVLSSPLGKDGNGAREHCQGTTSAGPCSASHNVLGFNKVLNNSWVLFIGLLVAGEGLVSSVVARERWKLEKIRCFLELRETLVGGADQRNLLGSGH